MVVVVLLLRKIAQGGVRELVDFDAPGEPFLLIFWFKRKAKRQIMTLF